MGVNNYDHPAREERIEHYRTMANFWRAVGKDQIARQTAAQYEGRLRELLEEESEA